MGHRLYLPSKAKFKNYLATLSAAGAVLMLVACGNQNEEPSPPEQGAETASTTENLPDLKSETAAVEQIFRAMMARHAEEVLSRNPEAATQLGVSEDIAGVGYQGRLGNYGFEADQESRALNETFMRELRSIDRASLPRSLRVTYDILRNAYEIGAQRNQFDFGGASTWGSNAPYRVTQLSGAHLYLPRLLQTQQPLGTIGDVENYLLRLTEMGRALDELGQAIGSDAEFGVVPPRFALKGAINSIRALTSMDASDHPIVNTFRSKITNIEGMDRTAAEAYVLRAEEIMKQSTYPAYQRLSDTLNGLEARSSDDAGIWRIGTQAEDFYQHALDSYGAQGQTGEEVHQIGLDEVARISAEMDAILKSQGLEDGSVAARFEELAKRPGNVYPNTDTGREDLLAELRKQVDDIMAKADDWFGTLPEQAVEVRRIPVYEQDSSAGGYYTGPSLDGTRPGIYWINLKNTADWPKHTLKTLTYHEAVPGHHFQVSLQRAIKDMPLVRNMMGYSEYSEGWALYAEKVAVEMGMYENDPLGNLGRLQSELFRAARLVVDTGLHHKRWTREEAIDYMVGVTGDTRASVTREIERYAVWPGQATSYKLGMLKMEELRERAEAALGDAFSIRDFHDEVLLAGAMPLPVLDARINAWIDAQQSN